MAITVTMYKNFSKKYNSTKQPVNTDGHTDFLCNLKDNTSVLDPVLNVYLSGQDPADTPIGTGYNYAYIPKWNRYYFITNWKYSRGIWIVSLAVDVLASYKTEIGLSTKYVLRSASNYDTFILDNCMTKLPPDRVVAPYKIAGVVKSPFTASNSTTGTDGSFIVGIQGPQPHSDVPCIGGVCYYLMNYGQMKELLDYMTSSTFAQLMKDDAAGLTEEVVKVLQDPSQYIVSCMWYPWTIVRNGTATGVQPKLGYWNTSPLSSGTTALGNQGFLSLSEQLNIGSGIAIPAHPQESGGDYGAYLRAAPYSLYKFHFEPWGDIEIDGSFITDADDIRCDIEVDLVTGVAALDLYAYKVSGSVYTPLGKYFAQVGVSVGIAQLLYEMQSIEGAAISAAASIVKDAANASIALSRDERVEKIRAAAEAGKITKEGAAGFEGMALGAVAAGVGETIQNAVSAGLAYMATPTRNGVNGNYISYLGHSGIDPHGNTFMTNGPYLEATFFLAADANNAEIGRPLRQSVQLNTLSGYLICAESDVDIAALESEKAMIGRFLTGGFFYE